MTGAEVGLRRRFLFLRALRWFPVGLLIPVLVLFVLSRGFTIGQLGTAIAAQAVVVLLLELPTGGLADIVGPRPVLLLANVADLISVGLLVVADSFWLLVLAWALQGIYRSLESGPLEAWYVTARLGIDPEADIESDMANAGTVTGIAVAVGSIASSALIAAAPVFGVEPLLLPILVAMTMRVVDLAALTRLVTGRRQDHQPHQSNLLQAVAEVPTVIRHAVKLITLSRSLIALLTVELLWGIGLFGFESLFPPRLAEVINDPERAAVLLGPVGTAAWLLSAAGSATVPALSRRIGPSITGAALRIAQGATVLALAVLSGPSGLAVAYLATLAIHGASNTIHSGILHHNTDSGHRTTVLSANSMASHLGGGIGSITIGLLASSVGLTPAITVAAVTLAAAAPLYLLTRNPNATPTNAEA